MRSELEDHLLYASKSMAKLHARKIGELEDVIVISMPNNLANDILRPFRSSNHPDLPLITHIESTQNLHLSSSELKNYLTSEIPISQLAVYTYHYVIYKFQEKDKASTMHFIQDLYDNEVDLLLKSGG